MFALTAHEANIYAGAIIKLLETYSKEKRYEEAVRVIAAFEKRYELLFSNVTREGCHDINGERIMLAEEIRAWVAQTLPEINKKYKKSLH